MYCFVRDVQGANLNALPNRLLELHTVGKDTDWFTDTDGYLDQFNANPDIQAKLQEHLTKSHLSKKHSPS